MRNVGLYWFGNDLRVHDNANLLNAASEVDDLPCIYCVDTCSGCCRIDMVWQRCQPIDGAF